MPGENAAAISYFEIVRVSWLIVWRYFLMSTLFSVMAAPVLSLGLVGILATLGVSNEAIQWTIRGLALLASPLLLYPVIVQMVLAKQFRGFEIQAVRTDGVPDSLSFTECFGPAILLTIVYVLGVYPVTIGGMFLARTWGLAPPPWLDVGLPVVLALFAVYPLALKLMLKRRFGDFRFEVLRQDDDSAGAL